MSNTKRDENNVPTMLSILNTDGETLTPVQVNATIHALKVNDNSTGSNNGPTHILRDENSIPVLYALSSADNGAIVPLYVDSDGKLLIQST